MFRLAIGSQHVSLSGYWVIGPFDVGFSKYFEGGEILFQNLLDSWWVVDLFFFFLGR